MLRAGTSTVQAIVRKYDGPTSYRTKSLYDRKINVRVRRNRHKLSYDAVRWHRTKFRRTRTIACGHFVRRTSVFYTRTIAYAVACDRAIACADPNESFWRKNLLNNFSTKIEFLPKIL